jgi:hypothetical protein
MVKRKFKGKRCIEAYLRESVIVKCCESYFSIEKLE